MFCPNCGTQLTDGARFCAKCGAQISATAQPANQNYGTMPQNMQQNAMQNQYASPQPANQQMPVARPSKKRMGIIIGAIAGAVVVVALVVIMSFGGNSFKGTTWYSVSNDGEEDIVSFIDDENASITVNSQLLDTTVSGTYKVDGNKVTLSYSVLGTSENWVLTKTTTDGKSTLTTPEGDLLYQDEATAKAAASASGGIAS